MSHKKKSYLPNLRTNYFPTQSKCNSYTEVGHPENMPNPATDPIVVNNIACQEFDYTQDMIFDDPFE